MYRKEGQMLKEETIALCKGFELINGNENWGWQEKHKIKWNSV